ncbi:Exopolyphosphatase [Sporothrix stenoceras]
MAPRSLAAFLKAARSALTAPASQRPKPLTLVIGNESADLDSLCSAILLAYFRSHTPPHNASLHVPLCNLPRADLALRPELQAALAGTSSVPKLKSDSDSTPDTQGGVPLDSLITLSELPDDLVADDTKWLLVDHNALTGNLAKRFQSSVAGCIDHHVDEGVVPTNVYGFPRVIETCGSCASLVVEYAQDAWRQLSEQEPDQTTDRVLARLALAPILVDTSSLKSANKTTDTDRRAAAVAEAVLGVSGEGKSAFNASYETDAEYNRSAYYDELSRLKNDLSTFTYSDILRKDYKQWTEKTRSGGSLTVGFSTVSQGLGYLLKNIGDKNALLDGLYTHAKERNLDIAVIMTVQHDEGGFARQLLLWALNEPAVHAVKRQWRMAHMLDTPHRV